MRNSTLLLVPGLLVALVSGCTSPMVAGSDPMRTPGHRDASSVQSEAGPLAGDAGPVRSDSGAMALADASPAPSPTPTPSAPDASPTPTPTPTPAAPDAGPTPTPTPTPAAPDAGPPAPAPGPTAVAPVFGVTIDNPWSPSAALLRSLDGLVDARGRRPMTRIVFDEGIDRVFRTGGSTADAYVAPVTAIGAHARIMGELLDSYYMPTYDVAQLRARACEYRATLGHLVDVWEIGNEVNGEWLLRSGAPDTDVVDQIVAVAQVFEAGPAGFATQCPGFTVRPDERPFEISMTAYGNGPTTGSSCWQRSSHQMETWLATNFGAGGRGAAVREGIDYLFVSYYEDDCNGLQPAWPAVFDRLGTIFPSARLGFGECGTIQLAQRVPMVQRYYGGMNASDPAFANMRITHPRYVGGFFWWYFSRDYANAPTYAALVAAQHAPFWSR